MCFFFRPNQFELSGEIESRPWMRCPYFLRTQEHLLNVGYWFKGNWVAPAMESLQVATQLHRERPFYVNDYFSDIQSSESQKKRRKMLWFAKRNLLREREKHFHFLYLALQRNVMGSLWEGALSKSNQILLPLYPSHTIRESRLDNIFA